MFTQTVVPLGTGVRVKIVNIQSRAELNGCVGTCVTFHKKKGRWQVRVDNDGDEKLLKEDNLRRMGVVIQCPVAVAVSVDACISMVMRLTAQALVHDMEDDGEVAPCGGLAQGAISNKQFFARVLSNVDIQTCCSCVFVCKVWCEAARVIKSDLLFYNVFTPWKKEDGSLDANPEYFQDGPDIITFHSLCSTAEAWFQKLHELMAQPGIRLVAEQHEWDLFRRMSEVQQVDLPRHADEFIWSEAQLHQRSSFFANGWLHSHRKHECPPIAPGFPCGRLRLKSQFNGGQWEVTEAIESAELHCICGKFECFLHFHGGEPCFGRCLDNAERTLVRIVQY